MATSRALVCIPELSNYESQVFSQLQIKGKDVYFSVVYPDPDRVGSTVFSRSGSGSKGMPIRIRPTRNSINATNFNMTSKILKIVTFLKQTRKIKQCKLAKL
jgi:hypothetical protein